MYNLEESTRRTRLRRVDYNFLPLSLLDKGSPWSEIAPSFLFSQDDCLAPTKDLYVTTFSLKCLTIFLKSRGFKGVEYLLRGLGFVMRW